MKTQLTITEKDLRTVVALLDPARDAPVDEEFPASFVTDLAKLIPCSYATFSLINRRNKDASDNEISVEEWSPYQILPPDIIEELEDLFWTGYLEEGGDGDGDHLGVERASAAGSLIVRRKGILGEYGRRLGAHDVVTVSLPPTGLIERHLLLWRNCGPDFSDREVMLLQMLRPHLVAVHARQTIRRNQIPELTPRQWEIIRLLAVGLNNTQLARTLEVSEATIRKHLENIYTRLDVTSRTAALAKVAPIMDTW